MGTHVDSLVDLLDRSAVRFGERVFAQSDDSDRSYTFAGLADAAARIAAGLRDQGVQPGDHVALLLPNCVSFLPAYFGILKAGAVAVPINIRLKPAELEFILGDSDIRALFVHPRTWPVVEPLLQRRPDLAPCIISVDFPTDAPGVPVESFLGVPDPTPALPASGEGAEPLPPTCGGIEGDKAPQSETAAIIYTSGTTGRPKGAMLSHENVLFNVEATKAGHGLKAEDVHLLVVPLFHVTGLNTITPTALDQGARVVLSSQVDPAALLSTIARLGCTTFFGVPTTFYLLTNLKEIPPDAARTLRLICYSGAPMAPLTIRKLREMFPGVELHNFFGLTETTSVSTVLPDDQALSRVESVGLPPPGVELAIVSDEGQFSPPGEVGELVIRGPSVFQGYYKRPEATAEALRDGWFHTGDAARLDEEGYLFLQGRKKEMIIVAGENVYPIEVENALCAHRSVQEAAVFGRKDAILGETVHAAVVLRPGAAASERDLKAHLNERLASFKMPRSIRILDHLPRNPSGKVVKREL